MTYKLLLQRHLLQWQTMDAGAGRAKERCDGESTLHDDLFRSRYTKLQCETKR